MGRIIQRGEGPPIVLVPGIQGRHEWQMPTVAALADLGRVTTFSLCDEPTSQFAWTEAAGFENYLSQLDQVRREAGAERPVVVGISYGGLIAAEYAARHPEAVAGLVVASAPPPGWVLPVRAQRYLAAPWLMGPAFWLGAPVRTYPELRAAFPAGRDLLHFVVDHGWRIASAPASSARMVRRLHWLAAARFSTAHPIPVPALLVTGEAALERVVPPEDTLRYLQWLPEARVAVMPRTGHSGTVTRAGDFARLIADFMLDLRDGAPVALSDLTSRSHSADRVC